MRTIIVLLLFVLAAAFTCNKDARIVPGELLTTYTYAQTQCADPWKHGPTDEATADSVRQYLAGKSIQAGWISVKQTYSGAVCLACTCPSGKTIYVGAARDESTREIMANLGFKE